MSLITSATNTGLSIKQQAISAAPLGAAAAAAAIPPAKKYAVEETHFIDILNNAAGLRANVSNISSINVTDTGVLSLTKAQYKDNASLISKLSGNRQFKITDAVTMEEMSALVKNKNVVSIAAVTDTAANIEAGMGTLISNNGKLNAGSITKTVLTADIAISSANYKQANAAAGVLSKFAAGSFTAANLNVTGASASDVAGILSDTTKVKTVSITDSVANIFNNAAALTTNIAKVGTVTATAAKTPFMRIAATGANGYAAYTAANSGLITKVNAGNANALKDAFVLTGAVIADVTAGIIADTKVKSIEVTDTATLVAGATAAQLAKVSKADVNTTDLLLKASNASLVTSLANLGSKLSSVTLTAGNKLDGLDVANIKDKSKALVLAKTKGANGDPIGLEIVNATLADVNGLLANKQVNKADIADTAKNMLAFSADKFTTLANAKTVTFAITDNATNISKYHTLLETAVSQFNRDRVSLNVKDTAANLTANLENLDSVASAITKDSNNVVQYDSNRIKIKQIQVSNLGVETNDTASMIKVAYSNYSARRDVLQYVADATGITAKHVEIDTTSSLASQAGSAQSINNAKNISTTLTTNLYIATATAALQQGNTVAAAPAPPSTPPVYATGTTVVAGTAATMTGTNAIKYNGVGLYEDVAQIDIKLKGNLTQNKDDFAGIQGDADFTPESLAGATPTYGLRTNVSISVLA